MDKDGIYMQAAIIEAGAALQDGNYPIGAVLVIDGEIVDRSRNSICSENNWHGHAESNLIIKNSQLIKKKIKTGSDAQIYTTLEPCLMCLGTIVLHRISKIIYACADPHGGSIDLNPELLAVWYKDHWPKFEQGPFKYESLDLMIKFLTDKPSDKEVLGLFKDLR
jgi:tRNA(Arg) A34 adenosine deaminase TadA